MSLPGSGCCCGVIVGIFLALLVSVAATVGVYCWVNPDVRTRGVESVAGGWDKVKEFGDSLIEKTRTHSVSVSSEPAGNTFSGMQQ